MAPQLVQCNIIIALHHHDFVIGDCGVQRAASGRP
jgi:hypothetical protein